MIETTTNQPLACLSDIVSNIQIQPNFCIQHPKYQPFALPSKVAGRFQQNPPALKHKYLTLLLRNFLYGIYYNGSLQTSLAVNNHENLPTELNLCQTSSIGIDWDFYQQLHSHNYGIGHYDSNWQVVRVEPDGSITVNKNDLTLYVESECHLKSRKKTIKSGELISIWMPKNRLENGYYVAVSNQGQEYQNTANLTAGRIYFNCNPEGAIALMDNLTNQLNSIAIPFSFQVLYHPSTYGRYDAGILHFERDHYSEIRKILQSVYRKNQSYFQPEIPLFTKFLAPGLGLAEEPSHKFNTQENFGMNRCQIVANALLEAWEKGKNAIEEKVHIIEKHFAQHLIDVKRPYLNPSSEDIYIPLNC